MRGDRGGCNLGSDLSEEWVSRLSHQVVAEGAELLVMEAMKMELSLKAPRAGVIAELRASVGEFVEADAVLVRLE